MKRVEVNKKTSTNTRVRASRTGGINGSVKLGKNATYNTKHGLHASKTYNGLTFGVRNNNKPFIRGRKSFGDINVNLSKSGVSASKNLWLIKGAYNFTRPQFSSITLFGIQRRGHFAGNIGFLILFLQIALAIPFIAALIIDVLSVIIKAGLFQLANVFPALSVPLYYASAFFGLIAILSQIVIPTCYFLSMLGLDIGISFDGTMEFLGINDWILIKVASAWLEIISTVFQFVIALFGVIF